MCCSDSSHAALAEPEENDISWQIAALLQQHAVYHVTRDYVHSLLEAAIEVHLRGCRVEVEVVAPVEASEIEGERCGCLERDAGCFGEGELGAERGEGDVTVAEAVEEKEDVDGLLGWRGCGVGQDVVRRVVGGVWVARRHGRSMMRMLGHQQPSNGQYGYGYEGSAVVTIRWESD